MTVIAYDGKKLVADKLSSCNGMASTVTKVHKINGHLIGGAGSASSVREFLDWFAAGANPDDYPQELRNANHPEQVKGFSVLVITPEGEICIFEDTPYPIVIEEPWYAVGSGADYAMAVMHMGGDAREAVEVASYYSTTCGRGMDQITMDDPDEFSLEELTAQALAAAGAGDDAGGAAS